jgi:hypothetical protein
MNRRAFWLYPLALAVFSFSFVIAHFTALPQEMLANALPEDDEVKGWIKHRALHHYEGEDLYEYINGGAEIYHEYGFVQVLVQDYTNEAGKSISIEIFEMDSPDSAYGMYTFKTDSKGKRIRVGTDGQLADYYMNFWKGPMLVTLTGFDETDETCRGLLDIANRVNSKITGDGERPSMAYLLPKENLVDQSLKYFTGILGLRSSHPFFYLDILGFKQGIKGDYSGGFSLFLFRFADDNECREGFAAMEGQKDRKGRPFFMATHRKYLLLVLGKIDHQQAQDIFDRVRKKIRS